MGRKAKLMESRDELNEWKSGESNLWSEIECRLDVFVLCSGRSPGVIELETLVAEI